MRGGDDGTTTIRAAGEKHGDLTAARTLLELTTTTKSTTTTTITTATMPVTQPYMGRYIRYERNTIEQKKNRTRITERMRFRRVDAVNEKQKLNRLIDGNG